MFHKNNTKGTQKWLIHFPKGPQHIVLADKTTKQTNYKNQIKQQLRRQQKPNAEIANVRVIKLHCASTREI